MNKVEDEIDEMNSATIVVSTKDGYQATYFWSFFRQNLSLNTIEEICNRPNIGYRFERRFNHFLFYKDNFSYDAEGQYNRSELVGIEDDNLDEDAGKEKCLESLLGDNDILYKTVFLRLRERGPVDLHKVERKHAGWVE